MYVYVLNLGKTGLNGKKGSRGITGSNGKQGPPGSNSRCILGDKSQNVVGT